MVVSIFGDYQYVKSLLNMNQKSDLEYLWGYKKEYHFDLPEEYIAKYPIVPRDHANLMIVKNSKIWHDKFYHLDQYIPDSSVLVFNHTKVSFRRVYLWEKETKRKFEVLFLELVENNIWKCLIRKGKKIKVGNSLQIGDFDFILEKRDENFFYLSAWIQKKPVLEDYPSSEVFFERFGVPPIPPYLKRDVEKIDKIYYQTIFAEKSGSVAAPTASLHFTDRLLTKIKKKSKIVFLNLQIGYGTFSPLTEKNFLYNELHEEQYEIPEETEKVLNQFREKGNIIAVGTTVLRALEDNFRKFRTFRSGTFSTRLFIKPPDRVESVDYLITNFHLPASSLFILICAFGGKEFMKRSYQIAIEKKYRFFSYGDGMFIQNIQKNKN